MKKKDALSSTIKLDKVDGSWEDNPVIQKLAEHGRTALIVLLAALALIFLVYRVTMIGKEQEEMDFWTADKEFRTFSSPQTADTDPLDGEEALVKLNSIIKSNPELHAKYDGLIAQTLINRGDAGNAIPFANLALARTEAENQPYYTNYTQTTLLIAQERYEDALKQALVLDKQMRESLSKSQPAAERKFGDTLFAFNLVRIGILQQQLGLKNEERKTWQEWQQYLKGEKSSELTKAFKKQSALITEGKTSLSDYIEARIASLK